MNAAPVCTRPLLFVIDQFLDEASVARLLSAVSPETLAARGVEVTRWATGVTAEVPVASDPSLGELAARLTGLLGVDHAAGDRFRVRHDAAGDARPPRRDDDHELERGGAPLAITAQLFLTDVEGGETTLARAETPIQIRAIRGRLAVRFETLADGSPDPASEPAIEPIHGGARTVLTWLVHATDAAMFESSARGRVAREPRPLVAHWPIDEDSPRPARRATLHCLVEERTPDTTREALQRACRQRGVSYRELRVDQIDPCRDPLPPGALFYSPATSPQAERVERQLWQSGVITFHRRSEGPFGVTLDPTLAFARAGLPVPRAIWITTRDRDPLKRLVDHVGGLPAIVRVDGGEGGVGVMRADTLPALFGLVDLLLSRGLAPRLVSYVPDATHYRLIVVGERVVTAYRNPIRADDFRSEPGGDESDYGLSPGEEMAGLAVDAARVVGSEFAGVDVIEHQPTGRLYLLEANFPCYFPQAEEFGKADVAGAMLDHLLAKRDEAHAARADV